MQVSEELKAEVQQIEKYISRKRRKREEVQSQRESKKGEAQRLEERMGFRERYLAGWFGGEKNIVSDLKKLNTLVSEFNDKAQQLGIEMNILDERIKREIDVELRRSDTEYQELLKPYEASSEAKEAVDDFLNIIDNALSEVDDGQGMEVLDLITDSTAVSVLSWLENDEAQAAIEAVESAAPHFQRAVENYNASLKTSAAVDVHADISDGMAMALVFHLAFDGFDFMNLFTLAALSKAEDSLRSARREVQQVADNVSENLQKSQNNVSARVKQVRLACS